MTSLLIAAAALSLLAPAAASAPGVSAGARIAAQKCASCHATGAAGRSPNTAAPAFRDIRLRYNALSLERELAKIARQGHYEMPALAVREDEARDLADYIETLGPPKP